MQRSREKAEAYEHEGLGQDVVGGRGDLRRVREQVSSHRTSRDE